METLVKVFLDNWTLNRLNMVSFLSLSDVTQKILYTSVEQP